MRNALGLGSSLVLAMVALAGCNPTPAPMLNPDAGPRDGGSVDTGVIPPDTNVPTPDGGRDAAITPGSCSYGGGCDLLSPTSCPDMAGTRQACYPGMTASECAPAGTHMVGEACEGLNDCDTGSLCLDTGTCAAVCCSNDDCELGATCRPLSAGGSPLPNGVGVCIVPTTCTVIPNSCPSGSQCQLTGTDGSTDCNGTGPNTEGMPCARASGPGMGGCVEGLGCYGSGAGDAVCLRFCHLGSDADCTGGGSCNASGLGSDEFGLCQGG